MHFVFGTAMHEALQHYLQTMFDQSAKVADEMDLNRFFKDKMIEEYNKYKKKHGHFTTPEELQEFYLDGEGILDWFKKHKRGRKNYFSKRKHELKGIEVPLILQPIKERPNIKYMGYVDLIIYDKRSESYTIFDIKTSTKGWSKEDFTGFIRECYTAEGNPVDKEFEKKIGKPCDWCDFGKNRELCGASLSPEEKFFSF
jgi:hypothetical protein